jgi:hypothetical protein
MPRDSSRSVRVAIAFGATAVFLFACRYYLGLVTADDVLYLRDGAHMGLKGMIFSHDWGPLYSLWFRFLTLFVPNPLTRYFVSWGLIVSAVALVPTLFQRPGAWLYTLIVLCLPITTESPFVGLFAGAMILTAFCWFEGRRLSYAESLFFCTLLSFVVTFARPEYNNGALLAAAATLVAVAVEWVLRQRGGEMGAPRSRLPAWLMVAVVALVAVTVIHLIRVAPSFRAGMAFAQHFNVRSSKMGLIPDGPDNWRSNYAELRFGVDTDKNALTGTATIGQFFRANPRLFLGQIVNNLEDYHTYLLVIFVLAVAALPWFARRWAALRPASLVLLLLAVPPLAGSMMIYPHWHYAAIILPVAILFALQMLDPDRWISIWMMPVVGVATAAFLVYLYVFRQTEGPVPERWELITAARVECARQWLPQATLASPNAFSLVETDPFLVDPGRTFHYQRDFATWKAFQDWVDQAKPAWVAMDDERSGMYWIPISATRYGVKTEAIDAFLKQQGYIPHPCSDAARQTVYTHP